MKLTRNLKIFTILSLILNISFVLSLKFDWLTEVTKNADGTKTYSTYLPFYYMIALIIAYIALTKTDKVRQSRYDLELMYSAVFYISIIISVIVAMIIIPAFRNIYFPLIPVAITSAALALQWFTTRKKIKGMKTKSVFK
jgi:uncharacterized membrane protein